MAIFGTLNNAYSGLSTSQRGVDTTSHNISNAENKDYTRQRVTQETMPSQSIGGNQIGTGTQISSVERVHNEFIFTRYQQSTERMAFSSTLEQSLTEISSFFPDMDGVGIKNDLENYYRSWSSLATDPSNVALKEVLASSTENLAIGIRTSYEKIDKVQDDLNSEIEANIVEVNASLQEIASLNSSIFAQEADGSMANDLRDKRDALETKLSKLIGAEFTHGNISDSGSDPSTIEAEGLYTAIVGGVALVSGTSYNKLTLDQSSSRDNYSTINFKKKDGSLIDMSNVISKGSIGALLDLRGSKFDSDKLPTDGIIPEIKDNLDTFTKGLIQHTNSIYAESASTSMSSNSLDGAKPTDNVMEKFGLNEGSFNIVVYNEEGDEVGKRTIYIDEGTSFSDGESSLISQLTAEYDDNGDGSLTNDFGSLFSVATGGDKLSIFQKEGVDFKFGIEDNSSNFAGALGMNRFFDGTDSSNIELNRDIKRRPDDITSFKAPVEGDNGVADAMSRLETENWKFGDTDETILGAYNIFAVDVASKTEQVQLRQETIQVQFDAIETQLNNISKVSIDNELVNLMKYQTAYAASGKVITTLDRMIDTLLGIKQ
ncbi:Flagellar hook-filament junction FlgK [Thiovulum sp. ES]|nr:Flagellar hook-filament junction FlgK [Thiovulum sp. ES]